MAAVTWGCDVKRAEEPQFGEVSLSFSASSCPPEVCCEE